MKPLWGEQHNGILVNFKENSLLLKKIFNSLKTLVESKGIHDFEMTGRIKDAGMLAGKISRCQSNQDLLTTQYEEIGFRIVVPDDEKLWSLRSIIEDGSDFIKDYIINPRKDGIILGDDPRLCYRALHIYTKKFFKKKIEIQLMTQEMLNECHFLTDKYGPYWKQKDFKEKRIAMGDDR